jgi:hypothetical protein
MNDHNVIRSILAEQWPDESALVGNSTLEQISRAGQRKSESAAYVPEGGHAFDMVTTIELLTAAAVLAQELIKLYRLYTDTTKPSPEQLLEEMGHERLAEPTSKAEIRSRQFAIATSVLQKLEEPTQ